MIKIINADGKNEYEFIDILSARDNADNAETVVRQILDDVKKNGDAAVLSYSKKFDNCDKIEILDASDLKKFYEINEQNFVIALEKAKANIEKYHKNQIKTGFEFKEDGKLLGQIIRPLRRVALYVPGGKAAYPSTVLMNAIPAKIAGVKEIIMLTPPAKFEGQLDDILTAAYVAGVDKVIFLGGAQAIAALAYGTESIEKTDKIVGPGNIFVATAKRFVYGICDIDMIAGPSEILIVADGSANAKFAAADMLGQAEHDENASSVLLTLSLDFAKAVAKEIEIQTEKLSRKEIVKKSLAEYCGIIVCESFEKIVELANKIAPEHLELMIEDAEKYIEVFTNAGSIFLGNYSPEALGDYFCGTNHVLPTNGTARFASPLSVDSFVKKYSYIHYDKKSLEAAKRHIEILAGKEGFTAHKNSVSLRFEE